MKNYFKVFKQMYSIYDLIVCTLLMLLVLSIFDYINIFSWLQMQRSAYIIYLIVFALIITELFKLKVYNLIILKTINLFDLIMHSAFISTLIFTNIYNSYFKNYCLIILIFELITVLIRIYIISYCNKDNFPTENTIFDLKDLYENNISNINNQRIYIKDNDVNYDLLQRKFIINNMYQSIINCKGEDKFVIALEGAWGSGKTTLINNVKDLIKKNNNEIILIDDFDPWSYSNQKSMFRAMFDKILIASELKFSFKNANELFDQLLYIIFGDSKYENGIKLLFLNNQNKEIINIKKMINTFLKNNNKRIVFIIDNIERTEKENIIFLFKLIGNIFDFNRITYVLSFDNKRLSSILEDTLEIDYEYLKKIIQLEIILPEIHPQVLGNITEKCIKNILVLYGENVNNLESYNNTINEISKLLSSIRDLKRFLNSIINFNSNSNNYLNIKDIFLLEFIHNTDIELYQIIWENKKYFISQDTQVSFDLFELNIDSFNEEGRIFFDKLFSEKQKYKNLLSLLFPYVKKYLDGQKLRDSYNDKSEYQNSVTEKRIFNAKYFDLYFTLCENNFTEYIKIVDEFINSVNETFSINIISDNIRNLTNICPGWSQKYVMEVLQYNLLKFNTDRFFLVLQAMYNNIYSFDYSRIFLGINSMTRAEVIIFELLLKINDIEFTDFLIKVQDDYSKLYILDSIINFFNGDNLIEKNDRKEMLNETFLLMGTKIFNEYIDLYDDENYAPENIWGFYHSIKDSGKEIKVYFQRILSKNNIIRFLRDIMSCSHGENYNYYINKEYLELFTSVDNINDLIRQRTSNTQDEEFVLKVFNKFKDNPNKNNFHTGIVVSNEANIKV